MQSLEIKKICSCEIESMKNKLCNLIRYLIVNVGF